MAKFSFTACPLVKIEHGAYGTSREIEIMSNKTIRRTFEAKDLAEVHTRLDEICAEIGEAGESWTAWVDTAKGERAPRGFRAAKDGKKFDRDINPERVTVGQRAA